MTLFLGSSFLEFSVICEFVELRCVNSESICSVAASNSSWRSCCCCNSNRSGPVSPVIQLLSPSWFSRCQCCGILWPAKVMYIRLPASSKALNLACALLSSVASGPGFGSGTIFLNCGLPHSVCGLETSGSSMSSILSFSRSVLMMSFLLEKFDPTSTALVGALPLSCPTSRPA